jgi:hypothetical protein
MVRVTAVEALKGFEVRIAFTDGTERVVDLTPYLWGPIFEPLRRNPALFRQSVLTLSWARSCGRMALTLTQTSSMAMPGLSG